MEIWLDTCDCQAVAAIAALGIMHGVTSNPSLLAKAQDHEKAISKILEIQPGPMAVQVTAEDSQEMARQGEALHAFSKRIIVKVPVTTQGIVAMHSLSKQGIPVMATAIFEPRQALVAALAGAQYVAPYIGRMFDAGIDAYHSLQTMVKIFQQHRLPTKILAAALKTTEQIVACCEMGIGCMTLKHSLFTQFVEDDTLTMNALRTFEQDWGNRELLPNSLTAITL